jgi:hypothetical protein
LVSYTPLHYAVWFNRESICQHLLNVDGIDTNVSGSVGDRPLHLGRTFFHQNISNWNQLQSFNPWFTSAIHNLLVLAYPQIKYFVKIELLFNLTMIFHVPPTNCLCTSKGTRTPGWEVLIYIINKIRPMLKTIFFCCLESKLLKHICV